MNTTNDIIITTDSEIKVDLTNLTKAVKKSTARSMSLRPSRSFNRVKSLRPRTAVGIKKTQITTEELQDK